MNRDDFCRLYWSYYLVLEKDFWIPKDISALI